MKNSKIRGDVVKKPSHEGRFSPVLERITADGRLVYDVGAIISSETAKKHISVVIRSANLPASAQPAAPPSAGPERPVTDRSRETPSR